MPIKNIVIHQPVTPAKAARAKELRRNMTPAERILWASLRANRLHGHHFRRQQIIAPYIVDFYCHRADLVVEVDGGIHLDQREVDRRRDEALQARGLRVLRFSNHEVTHNLPAVLDQICRACDPIPLQNLHSRS